VIQRGTAKLAKNLGRNDLAGKTGTTNSQVDAWFAGYNPDIVAVTWVGFDQPQSLHEYGAAAALPMWMQFIQFALKDKPAHILPQPPGIMSIRIDPATGRRVDSKSGIPEYFMEPFLPEDSGNWSDADAIESNNDEKMDNHNRPDASIDNTDISDSTKPSEGETMDQNNTPDQNNDGAEF
jgi:penicillin-binding protein 1A